MTITETVKRTFNEIKLESLTHDKGTSTIINSEQQSNIENIIGEKNYYIYLEFDNSKNLLKFANKQEGENFIEFVNDVDNHTFNFDTIAMEVFGEGDKNDVINQYNITENLYTIEEDDTFESILEELDKSIINDYNSTL